MFLFLEQVFAYYAASGQGNYNVRPRYILSLYELMFCVLLINPSIVFWFGQCKLVDNFLWSTVYNIGAGTAQCTVELYNCIVEWGIELLSTFDKRAGFTSILVAGFHSFKLSSGFLLLGREVVGFDEDISEIFWSSKSYHWGLRKTFFRYRSCVMTLQCFCKIPLTEGRAGLYIITKMVLSFFFLLTNWRASSLGVCKLVLTYSNVKNTMFKANMKH